MIEQTRDRIRSARHRANGGRARAPRPHRGARRAVDKRTRAALLGAAVMGLITLVPLSAAAELSPEIQVDLYLVQTEAYIKEQDYAAAQEAMAKILDLQKKHDLKTPDVFHFKYAEVLERAGSYAEAIESLNRYLELAGRSGTHYREALELLHAATVAQTQEARKRPGARFRDCEGCPEVVVVPAGSYLMGSPSSEAGRDDNEGPQHRVTIGDAFAVGVHEVTFEQWDACVSAGGCGGYRPDDEGWGRGRRPVIHVSWEEALRFLEWLREATGERYRLLSEAEWEYVARAGTGTARYWGESETGQCRHANGADKTAKRYADGWTVANCDDGHYGTAPVGTFTANQFGLHDVHGNVYEWVQDCWNGTYAGAPTDGSAWVRGDCSRRVVRGGSWGDEPMNLRSASRGRLDSGDRNLIIGFRVARTLNS
ncbi:MAG: SUMF1/EgtB/PvdO family nonheme iron enzyme [Chloroflexota bacterium]|nr:SUMF1/EgtB/PvdO family nonheme iron enzyme [Chloroflexota bacterium]